MDGRIARAAFYRTILSNMTRCFAVCAGCILDDISSLNADCISHGNCLEAQRFGGFQAVLSFGIPVGENAQFFAAFLTDFPAGQLFFDFCRNLTEKRRITMTKR